VYEEEHIDTNVKMIIGDSNEISNVIFIVFPPPLEMTNIGTANTLMGTELTGTVAEVCDLDHNIC
jgi:hypothetical protein